MSNMTELRPFKDTVERVLTTLNQVSGIADPEQWLIDAFGNIGGWKTASGVNVNEYTAMGWPPLWAAVSRIAGHIATMPLQLHRKLPGGGSELVDDPRNYLVNNRPNQWQTGTIQREQIQMHALLHGNGKCLVVRDSMGMPIELIPFLPESNRTLLVRGRKLHWVITPHYWDYSTELDPGRTYYFDDEDVLHIQGLGGNGAWGYSVIHMMRNAIGLGLAGEQAASVSFANLGRPGIILEAPLGKFRDPKKAKEFVDKFDASQKGIDKTGKTALLREGVTAKFMTLNNEDAQFLQQRLHQREEASLMMFLEILTGDKGPYKSITEKNTQYMINCLNRWIVKHEQECNCKLLTEAEKNADELFWKFDRSVILQGDPNSLADYTGKLRQQGAISGNEVRDMHSLNKVDDETLNTYGNPNTTPGNAVPGETDEGDGEPDEGEPNDRLADVARMAVNSRLRAILNMEREKVVRAAGNKRDFAGFLTDFYANLEQDLGRVCVELGGDYAMAQTHCDISYRALKECAVLSDITQLADTVSGCVSQWDDRVETLTDMILQGALADV